MRTAGEPQRGQVSTMGGPCYKHDKGILAALSPIAKRIASDLSVGALRTLCGTKSDRSVTAWGRRLRAEVLESGVSDRVCELGQKALGHGIVAHPEFGG